MKFKQLLLVLVLALSFPAFAWEMKEAPLMTRWASQIDINNPFPDYPRPQLERDQWEQLNGIWQFQQGSADDSVPVGQTLTGEILVPFAMESAISGVMHRYERSWYRRTFEVPSGWSGKNVILHLDAVDWESEIFVNGNSVAVHQGGYDPIILDITDYLNPSGPQELIVRVYDATDGLGVPRGKQTLHPGGIMYTSVSGIWQSVWMEPVDPAGIDNIRMTPDIDTSTLNLKINTYTNPGNLTADIVVKSEGQEVASLSASVNSDLSIAIPNQRLWSPSDPFLYDLEITLKENSTPIDFVKSYFGMRKSSLGVDDDGITKMFLNNEFVFQMGPLDQGWWPDGLYTAPTEEAMKYDIEMTKAYGFNMTRKHIKVEPARWYYWCDKLGLMVWQDMPSLNSYTGSPQPIQEAQFELELDRMMDNLWNVPSIISWVVFNESQGQHKTEYYVEKVMDRDPSRLVNQGSGGGHFGVGDILDYHSYPPPNYPISNTMARVCGEYGGIGYIIAGHLWNPDLATGIYSNTNNAMEMMNRYDQYHDMLLNFKVNYGLSAAVYTEITDVENEVNGLMTYDRTIKSDVQTIANSNYKVITGDIEIEVVIPTSEESAQEWSYTTSEPAGNWYESDYNDNSWAKGYGGFGTDMTPNSTVRTNWNTSDIWVRRDFGLDSFTPAQLENLQLAIFYDEDCEVYLNGVLAFETGGYVTNYTPVSISIAAKEALVANGINTIAIHCHQTTGGQYIDAGLSIVRKIVNAPFVPNDFFSYWPMDDTSGDVAPDVAGNNNGTVYGANWNASGQLGSCISFDGVNDYVEVSRQIADDFSIAFWAKTTQTAAGDDFWWQGNGIIDADIPFQENDFGISLFKNTFAFGVGSSQLDQDYTVIGSTVVNDGSWHHCVATRNSESGLISLYIDGVLQSQQAAAVGGLTASSVVRFGSMNTDERYFAGQLDEVKFFDREIGDQEVAALYANTNAKPDAPVGVAIYNDKLKATLSWLDVFAASSYNVKRSLVQGGPYVTIANVTDNSYVDSMLDYDVRYFYVITAVNPAGESEKSDEVDAISVRLKAHFDAASLIGMNDGQRIALWQDISGNGFDASQSSYFRQPTYVSSAMNGHPAVHFNDSRETFLELTRPVEKDFTIVMVFKSEQGIGSGTNFYQGAGLINGEKPFQVADYGMSLNANGRVIAGTGDPDVNAVSGTGFNDGLPHVVVFTREQVSGNIKLFVDGEYASGATGSSSDLISPSRLTIGAQQTENDYLNGDISKILIYSIALSDAERVALEAELNKMYIQGYPAKPVITSPANGQINVSANPVIQWQTASGATSYRVRLADSIPAVVKGQTGDLSFIPASLLYETTYYLMVEAINGTGSSYSESYLEFTTAMAGDVELDGDVDLADFAIMAFGWLEPCSQESGWCDGRDIDSSGQVDLPDMQLLAGNWLAVTN